MEKVKETPCNEPSVVDYEGKLIFVSQHGNGKVSLSFDELSQNLKHEANQVSLEKVNYKTVVAALKMTHPNIISAKMIKSADEVYELIVTVSYEFLPQISEHIVFEKKEIGQEESQAVAVRTMRNYLTNIREQISAITNIQTITGDIDCIGAKELQLFVKIPHKKTVMSYSLNLKNPNYNMVKLQLIYYNSLTKQRKSTPFIPSEGVYLHHSGASAFMQIKFYLQLEDFDMAILRLEGQNYEGDYIVQLEKVQTL